MTDIDLAAPSRVTGADGAPSVSELVRAVARATPDASAVLDLSGGVPTHLTYRALLARADALTRRLRADGVGPQEPVAVLLDRSTDTVVAMLAVLASGGVYCPLDPESPAARTAALIGSLDARVAVADAAHGGALPAGTRVVTLDGSAPDAEVPDAEVPDAELPDADAPHDPDALAYVIFTSGSTGTPKGVAMPHRGLERLIRWQIADGPPALRTMHFTATSFDVTFQEVLSTLATGGCLVVVPDETRRDPAALLGTIVTHRVQRLFLPYLALQLLADAARRLDVVPSSLEHVVTAGERLVVTPAIRDLFSALPRCRLDNHYGPTEAHLATSHTLPADARTWPTAPPIGRPVDGVRCVVLDERLRRVPDGEIGELYLGGSGLARGYLGAPGQTAERFVARPAAGAAAAGPVGERLYRTGDLVRAGADGSYEYVGRADGQLKVRGFRVEPAEVEHALLSHPRVVAAAVGLREAAEGLPVLVAYLQIDGPVSHRELTDHLRELLPAHLVPGRYVPVAALPRTASGKIDGRALARLPLPADSLPADSLPADSLPAGSPPAGSPPADSPPGDVGAPDAPSTGSSLVGTITALWRRVLGHDEFDIDDDFFDVGGDSLLATWVVAELSHVLRHPVELSVFLESSTVEDLAEALGAHRVDDGAASSSSQIRTLRAGPSTRGVYLFHPLGGELLGYRELARASHAPVRMLGVGWSGEPPAPGSSLEQIAAVHVEQLRTIQPDGPYRLVGWSFGGVLAYETAQQLAAAGGTVDYLGLLDANPVLDPITGLPIDRTPFLAMLDEVAARLDGVDATTGDLETLTSNDTWIQLMGAPAAAGTSSDYLRRVLDTARACMRAAMDYRPRPYPGPVQLFQAADCPPDRRSALVAALRALVTGPFTVTPVPGDHWGVMRSEHVSRVAAELDAALERLGEQGE